MDSVIKIYRKFIRLTHPRFDRFERIIFAIHIPCSILFTIWMVDEPYYSLYYTMENFIAGVAISYFFPMALNASIIGLSIFFKWLIEPFSKDK